MKVWEISYSQSGKIEEETEMKERISCRLFLWILPPLIFRGSALCGIFTQGELFIGAAVMLPFFVWIAVVSSCRRNESLYYPSVVFLSLLQLWPLCLHSPPWGAGTLFAGMLVMSVILRGRVWIILHSVFLWLYGALLIAMLWLSQSFDAAFGAPKNPWCERAMGLIVFALIGVIFVRFLVRNMIDRHRKSRTGAGSEPSLLKDPET